MIRAGKPCFGVRTSPFIWRASSDDGFVAFASGTPTVYPSAHVKATQSAVGPTPASPRRLARGIPTQRAVPTRLPPTSLLTHSSVAISSVESARVERVAKEYSLVVETRPSIASRQSLTLGRRSGSRTFFVTV